jgi:hypothetical protein
LVALKVFSSYNFKNVGFSSCSLKNIPRRRKATPRGK